MKRWALAVVLLQLAVLIGLAAEREGIRAWGDTVWLRTAPVDPRDLFRGDYVQLDYEIAQPTAEQWQVVQAAADEPRQTVYASLAVDADGLAQLASLSLEKPVQGVFIRGRIGKQVWRDWRHRGRVKYGIEKYFVPQGEGLVLEERRGQRDGWQTPMEMAVALSPGGKAVVTGYRWSTMSVRLEVLEAGERVRGSDGDDAAGRRSPQVRFSLRNDGDTPLVLLDDARHCAFSLRQVVRGSDPSEQSLPWAARDCQNTEPDWQPVVLAPQAVHSLDIDFAEPDWFVQISDAKSGDEKAVELADADNRWTQYRLVYTPPPGINDWQAQPIWASPLLSAAFSVSGVVD